MSTSTSSNVIEMRKKYADAQAKKYEDILDIRQETGLDPEWATALYYYRHEGNWIEEHQRVFCEVFERRLAEQTADRLLGPRTGDGTVGNVIDWDRLDHERKRRAGNGIGQAPADTSHIEPQPTLPYVDLALPIVPREWLVPERIPMRNVSMLGGEGAVGKSLLLMQLAGAVVLGREWISTLPEPGPTLYLSCEEDDAEVCRRMEDVARHLGSTRAEMIERGLCIVALAGRDAVMAQPDRAGIMQPTPLFERLRRDALLLRPKLIVIDTIADAFGGRENDRAQTRQFVTLQRGLAIAAGAAVVMAAHPSLEGIRSDSGLSGSTGWHNSVRSRLYFKSAPGDDTSLRVLEVKKNNYGPVTESIVLRWRDGVYVIEKSLGTLERLAAEAEVDHLFMVLLRRSTEQGRNVSDKVSPSYAPAVFAADPEAAKSKIDKKAFAGAMARLFAAKKVRVDPFGPASRMRSKIVEIEGPE
jgi:RecA-family ATPase